MKKKSAPAKKTAKKTAKKPVKKAAPKAAKPAVTKAVTKAAAKTAKKPVKKAAAKVAKKATKKPVKKPAGKVARKTAEKVVKKAAKKVVKKVAPKAAKKAPAAKKTTVTKSARIEKAIVTTVLPPKLTASARPGKSGLPAQAAVKAPKAPQAKLGAAPEASTRKRLNKEELKFFENLLNEKKETLLQEQSYLEDNALRLNSKEGAGDLSSHAYHLADHATETQDREQAFHLASREGKFLFYIEEALDRVRNGTFGICRKCGMLIPKARLIAVPTAKMCISCKSQQEHATEATA